MSSSRPRLPGELTFMVLLVLGSAFLLWVAYGISGFASISSPGAFPMVCALAMVVSGLISLRQAARSPSDAHSADPVARRFVQRITPPRLVLFTLLIVVYMFGMEVLGFLVASYLFLAASMFLLGSRRVLLNLLLSALVLAAIFIVFRTAFSVVLPAGSLVGPHLPEWLK
jgi:putative tricarboxylic transport membrane protein